MEVTNAREATIQSIVTKSVIELRYSEQAATELLGLGDRLPNRPDTFVGYFAGLPFVVRLTKCDVQS